MTDNEKLEYIAESVELDVDELELDQILEDIETWDSVAVLSIIAVINEHFNRYPSADEIKAYKTVGDLMEALQ